MKILATVFVSLACCFSTAPAHAEVLEAKMVARLHVTEAKLGTDTCLHIRGLPFYSASSGCSKLKIKTDGDEMSLLTTVHFLRKGVPFDFVVTVPSTVKRVVFGKERTEIWPRNRAEREYTESERTAMQLAMDEFKKTRPDLNLDDYWVGVESGKLSPKDSYEVVFLRDGQISSPIMDLYRYWVSKSNKSVSYKGKSRAGALLEQLGKIDGSGQSREVP